MSCCTRSATLSFERTASGDVFFAEVQRTEKLISQFPESAEEIRPNIRKRALQKFRYSLIYSIDTEGLLVLAIAHHSRRPNYWVGRTVGAE